MKEKIIKMGIQIFLILILLYIALFFSGRYAWRMRGFNGCTDIRTYITDVEDVQEDEFLLETHTINSISAYVGNFYKIEGNRLYLGVKYNNFLGFTQRIGSGSFTIPCDTKIINEIVVKDFKEEKVIWRKDTVK